MTTGQPAPQVPGNRPSQRVLVIIPTYNERENLPLIHRRVKDACPDVHVLDRGRQQPRRHRPARRRAGSRPILVAHT